MKPSRDLDMLVAEKVMGIDVQSIISEPGWEGLNTLYSRTRIPQYSTDIAAAWEVVGQMFKLGWDLSIEGFEGDDGEICWRAVFAQIADQGISALKFAATPELAICLAALHALNEIS